eukprot:Sspe_Gene.82296::Locus_53934_Transcript_1_1_Confidence_1.000_Length_1185::g.82296::m.82296
MLSWWDRVLCWAGVCRKQDDGSAARRLGGRLPRTRISVQMSPRHAVPLGSAAPKRSTAATGGAARGAYRAPCRVRAARRPLCCDGVCVNDVCTPSASQCSFHGVGLFNLSSQFLGHDTVLNVTDPVVSSLRINPCGPVLYAGKYYCQGAAVCADGMLDYGPWPANATTVTKRGLVVSYATAPDEYGLVNGANITFLCDASTASRPVFLQSVSLPHYTILIDWYTAATCSLPHEGGAAQTLPPGYIATVSLLLLLSA